MITNQPEGRHVHMPELQSGRGLASLIVAVHHCSFFYTQSETVHGLAEAVFNAHAAVIFFFVLSGFVLTRALSLKKHSSKSWARFYVSRLFRIYPALWVALGLAIVYHYFIAIGSIYSPKLSQWFLSLDSKQISIKDLAMSALGISTSLMTILWSIKLELIGSICIPFLAYFSSKKYSIHMVVILAIFIAVLGLMTRSTTLVLLTPFVMGAVVFFYRKQTVSKLLPGHRPSLCNRATDHDIFSPD
jgi:peptidoglycan/LPS O-acetylase OafA/YrhL